MTINEIIERVYDSQERAFATGHDYAFSRVLCLRVAKAVVVECAKMAEESGYWAVFANPAAQQALGSNIRALAADEKEPK
jgi:hypothetical protein